MPKNRRYLLDLKEHWYKSDTRIYRVKFGAGGVHAKLVYGFLASTPEHFNPSEQNISQALDIAPNTVRKALELLVVNNVLKRSKGKPVHGRKPRNIYEFVPYPAWKLTCNIEQEFKDMAVNQYDEQATTSSDDVADSLPSRANGNDHLTPRSSATSHSDASPPHSVMNNKRRNKQNKRSPFSTKEPKEENTTSSNGERSSDSPSSIGLDEQSLGLPAKFERQGKPLDHSLFESEPKPELHLNNQFLEQLVTKTKTKG